MTSTPDLVHLAGFDGTRLAVHRLGAGRPVLLLHGLSSNAGINWLRYGHAQRIADAGLEAIMLDQRAHGDSAAPRDPAAWPRDALVRDAQAVLAALDITDFDLVGYSLGSRVSAMLVAAGARPRRLVLGGMGLEGLTRWAARRDWFLAALARWDESRLGDADFMAISFMKTVKADPVALRLLLESMEDFPIADLDRLTVPTLVLSGEDDTDNGSAAALAERLPDAQLETVPGNHMSCITKPEFGTAIARFLTA